MGSGLTSSITSSSHDIIDNNEQIEKLQARLLTSGETLSAFLKYLEGQGKDCILKWYFDILDYKLTDETNLSLKSKEIRSRYNGITNKTTADNSKLNLTIWKSIDDTLPNSSLFWQQNKEMLLKKLDAARKLTLSLLADEVEGFYLSSFCPTYYTGSDITGNIKIDRKSEISDELKIKYNRVLIIDDSPTNASRTAKMMGTNGYNIIQAHHGIVGVHLATVASNKFGAILIDMNMTTMDPVEVKERIQAVYNGQVYTTSSSTLETNKSQSKSLRISTRKTATKFNSTRMVDKSELNKSVKSIVTVKSHSDDGNSEKYLETIFISLVRNNPIERFDKTLFHGSIALETYVESDLVTDLSIITLMFDFHDILKKLNDKESSTSIRGASSVSMIDKDAEEEEEEIRFESFLKKIKQLAYF